MGSVEVISGSFLQDWRAGHGATTWRDGSASSVDVLLDIGVHWIDLAEHLTNDRITNVFAMPLQGDGLTVSFETMSGASGFFAISQRHHGHKNDLDVEVVGRHMSARWRQQEPDLLWLGSSGEKNVVLSRETTLDLRLPMSSPYPTGHIMGWPMALKLALEQFVDGVKKGRIVSPTATLDEGIHNMLVCQAIAESVTRKESVPVENSRKILKGER